MRYYKKILFFLLTISFLFGIFSFVLATEVALPGWDPEAIETRELLPEYIRYIFNFSLMVAGLIAFGVLVYSGFCYLISAGNPTKMSDAKDRIFSAFLGLVILLGSYIILVTIDPRLVVLRPPERPVVAGIILYDAEDNSKVFTTSASKIEEFNAIRYEIIKIPENIEIRAWSQENFGGNEQLLVEPAGHLAFPPRSLEFRMPEPPFDFAFSIDPVEARIDSKYDWWHDWPGSNTVHILLRTKLLSGTPETVTFSVKNIPDKVDYSFPAGISCLPTCNLTLSLIANGATPDETDIIIEAHYEIDGQPQPPRSAIFTLKIEDM